MDQWSQIRNYVLIQGHKKSEACRKFDIDYRTLMKILKYSSPPGYQMSKPRPKRVIEPYLKFIELMLLEDKHAPRKQKHTARRIFHRLRDEHGYQGGETSVKVAVREMRKTVKDPYMPLDHPPAQAQVDFGFASVYMRGVLMEVAIFAMTLPYSGAMFMKAYPRECTQTFQDGHVAAFTFFGGVPQLITYDNSRVAVIKLISPRERVLTEGFMKLQSHFLFDYHFCLSGTPEEKGHVEKHISFGRSNFLVPVPRCESFEELNAHLAQMCQEDLSRVLRGKEGSKQELLEIERRSMLLMPEEAFEAKLVESRRASSLSLIRFDCNDYSVPTQYAYQHLTAIGLIDEVIIMDKDEVIAVHRRDWQKEKVHYQPIHYLALLERKPHSFDFGKPFKDWYLPECFDTLRRKLEAKEGTAGTKEFIRVLRMLEHASCPLVTQSIKEALRINIINADAVRVILEGYKEQPVAYFKLDGRPHLQSVHVQAPDLNAYSQLQAGGLK